jgi:ankyrin repeat protein
MAESSSKEKERAWREQLAREMGLGPLHNAAILNKKSTAKQLLAEGENANVRAANRVTPLMLAALFGRKGMAKLLIEKGAHRHLQDHKKRRAIDVGFDSFPHLNITNELGVCGN